jgi:hypothetical protein
MKRVVCLAVSLLVSLPLAGQQAPSAADLAGTWELVTIKDMKTGKITRNSGTAWMQFTKSHWTVLDMDAGRKAMSVADFNKLSPDAKMKANYARIWNNNNEQVFAARGGTYTLTGDRLHHPATIAIYGNIIGVDRVLKINRLDKTAFVAQTEYPDDPEANVEFTYRRID